MTHLVQPICLSGRPVAVTVGCGEASVSARVDEADLPVVQAMCLYALEVASGERKGPYHDRDAERYARRAIRRGSR